MYRLNFRKLCIQFLIEIGRPFQAFPPLRTVRASLPAHGSSNLQQLIKKRIIVQKSQYKE